MRGMAAHRIDARRSRDRDRAHSRRCAIARRATAIIELILLLAALVAVFTTVGDRLHPGLRVARLLRARLDQGLPDRHDVDAAVRRCPLRHPAAGVGHADGHRRRAAGGDPARHHHRDLPVRVRAAPRCARSVKPVLELLGAVPTVVYGYFALLMVTPLLQKICAGTAGLQHAERRAW
ncbi:MAG: hypothetical protein MZV65_53530 [Chromatiales bacterium]|nr:hypothetical protein [Chromatiales bacterium]